MKNRNEGGSELSHYYVADISVGAAGVAPSEERDGVLHDYKKENMFDSDLTTFWHPSLAMKRKETSVLVTF